MFVVYTHAEIRDFIYYFLSDKSEQLGIYYLATCVLFSFVSFSSCVFLIFLLVGIFRYAHICVFYCCTIFDYMVAVVVEIDSGSVIRAEGYYMLR